MSIASLYPSINPSLLLDFANVKRLDPRITFTRTTTATYYDGVTTAKAEQNLYSYSQTFTTWWTSINASLTANSSTAPDGTNTATLMYPSSTGGETIIYPPSTNSTQAYTVSCYAKASGKSYLMLQATASSLARTAWFNLSTGAVGTVGADISSASITSVGSGWYRCAITFTIVGGIRGNIGLSDSDNSFSVTASGTNGIYIWGAQLEQRSSATAYTATTSQAITNYIPVLQTASAGQARFDHNPTTGESLGLLIEEARTNACPYSEAIGSWSGLNATAQSNVTIAPSGALTADKILPDATASVAHGWYNTITAAASTTYTISIFAKAAEYSWLYLTEGNNVTATAFFNLSTGALGTVSGTGSPSATITSVGNGWYRCSLTFTTAVGATEANIQARVTTADNTTSFTASSGTVGYSGIFVWGGQFETGSFATSYIPNLSTGSTTRNADAASMTGTNFSSWFNYGAMTIYYEATGYYTASGAYEVFDLDSGSNSGRIRTRFLSSEQASQLDASSNSTFSLDGGTVTANSFAKVAVGLTQNSQALSLNGGTVVTATAPFTTLPVPTTARIGTNWVPSEFLNGTIKKIAFYPVKVTNAQLQALTV